MTARAWLEYLAILWTGQPTPCEAGHLRHDTKVVSTPRFGLMEVFDWIEYQSVYGYCSGKDDVSQAIDNYGRWELIETDIISRLLSGGDTDKVVLDFGCHIGWFTRLALQAGYPTLALDADPEHLRLTRHGCPDAVPVLGFVDESTPVCLPPPSDVRIKFLKADVEGSEDQVVRVCLPLFEAGLIDSAMLEVSPIFKPHYPDTVRTIMRCGYGAGIIPTEPNMPIEPVEFADVERKVNREPQCNMLFVLVGRP